MPKIITFLLSIIFLISISFPVHAQTKEHFTLIINQVRGSECCSNGNIQYLEKQLEITKNNNLTSHYAIRYDVLQDAQFIALLNKYSENSYGGLLEITPSLAVAAKVTYKGSVVNWNEAQNVFLIGYTKQERQQLIDTFMLKFKNVFGYFPKYTVAWMIDPWSLKYLKEKYGVLAHELTREQFSTDSYTLTGGPVHYPYWPSDNWALVPQTQNYAMPLIVRQTVMDPVFCYGDSTSSYTSQPNDYLQRGIGLEYFQHLFNQAHQQNNNYTFALIGLENSMDSKAEQEYEAQLVYVADWVKQSADNKVISVEKLEKYLHGNQATPTLYTGKSPIDEQEQAIWVNTNNYRLRLRLSNKELFISDLRLYNPEFSDPYINQPAGMFGWWIVPFTLDGSRYFMTDGKPSNFLTNDSLKTRLQANGAPTRITLSNNIDSKALQIIRENDLIKMTVGSDIIATFNPKSIQLNTEITPEQNKVETASLRQNLEFVSTENKLLWGFNKDNQLYTPYYISNSIEAARQNFPAMLFPQLSTDQLNSSKTNVYINNQYAVVGRNPVRLILFPKDEYGNPVYLQHQIDIKADNNTTLTVQRPHVSNGMIYIDADNSNPVKTTVSINIGDYSSQTQVFFAPNCKTNMISCLLHPQQFWWYIRSFIGDKLREIQKNKDEKQTRFIE